MLESNFGTGVRIKRYGGSKRMNKSSWLWRILGTATLVCLLALLVGFGWALRDTWYPPEGLALPDAAPTASPTGDDLTMKAEILITALGDSLTVGTGDATGNGYVRGVTAGLAEVLDKPVRTINNLGINGLRADQLVQRLEERGYQNSLGRADIILLTIGGNDLFQIAQNGGSMAEGGGDLSLELLKASMPEAEQRLKAAFTKIRKINPSARLVYVGLYNPFYDVPEMRPGSQYIAEWNSYAQKLAEADGNATVVPTYDLFEDKIAKYLSSDHFHPNAQGYARIAERIVQALY